MDPITTAIVAAITAGATTGLTETSKTALTDSYNGLKSLLTKHFGTITPAVEAVEIAADSPSRQTNLAKAVTETGAIADPAVVTAAEKVMTALRDSEQGNAVIQEVINSFNTQAINGSTATVSITIGNKR